jgi:DNA-directed RNA polymerase specialized sigma24 family protein
MPHRWADSPVDDNAVLVERLRQRDPAASSALYDLYGRVLFLVIERIVQRPAVVEALVQETLVRAWNRSSELSRDLRSIGPWLVGIATKCATDYVSYSRETEAGKLSRKAGAGS